MGYRGARVLLPDACVVAMALGSIMWVIGVLGYCCLLPAWLP